MRSNSATAEKERKLASPELGVLRAKAATAAERTPRSASGSIEPTARREVRSERSIAFPDNRQQITDNRAASGAFTIIELLVVTGIIALLLVLVVPAFTSIKTAGDVTSAAYTIKGVLEQARSYAMANNTYVWVGFEEVDVSKDASLRPQTAGTGRLAIAVVASNDGTKHYQYATSAQGADWQANYGDSTKIEFKGGHLTQIGRLQRLENSHLAASLNGSSYQPPTSGGMARPWIKKDYYVLGHASSSSATPFTYPLGTTLTDTSSTGYQYRFDKAIQFDPEGVARIITATNKDEIALWMEVGLQLTHGNSLPPNPPDQNQGNQVAIQLDGMTGSIRTYRPSS